MYGKGGQSQLVRVLLVDDHPVVLAGLRALLEAELDLVVGEAATGLAAISIARELRPEVVVTDLLLAGRGRNQRVTKHPRGTR